MLFSSCWGLQRTGWVPSCLCRRSGYLILLIESRGMNSRDHDMYYMWVLYIHHSFGVAVPIHEFRFQHKSKSVFYTRGYLQHPSPPLLATAEFTQQLSIIESYLCQDKGPPLSHLLVDGRCSRWSMDGWMKVVILIGDGEVCSSGGGFEFGDITLGDKKCTDTCRAEELSVIVG